MVPYNILNELGMRINGTNGKKCVNYYLCLQEIKFSGTRLLLYCFIIIINTHHVVQSQYIIDPNVVQIY